MNANGKKKLVIYFFSKTPQLLNFKEKDGFKALRISKTNMIDTFLIKLAQFKQTGSINFKFRW